MRKLTLMAAIAAATALTSPAMAGSPDGKLQIKLLATGVLPDGKITDKRVDLVGLPAGAQTKANDNIVPTVAIEYYFMPSVSVETICCLTQHHIDGDGAISGTRIVDHVLVLPATVTLKYHLDAGPIKPYVGVGPALFLYFGEKQGSTLATLNPGGSLRLKNDMGVALQGGVDIPVNDSGMGISLDAKKYFMKTTLHVKDATGTEILQTRHKLDPWVLSGGVYFRF